MIKSDHIWRIGGMGKTATINGEKADVIEDLDAIGRIRSLATELSVSQASVHGLEGLGILRTVSWKRFTSQD